MLLADPHQHKIQVPTQRSIGSYVETEHAQRPGICGASEWSKKRHPRHSNACNDSRMNTRKSYTKDSDEYTEANHRAQKEVHTHRNLRAALDSGPLPVAAVLDDEHYFAESCITLTWIKKQHAAPGCSCPASRSSMDVPPLQSHRCGNALPIMTRGRENNSQVDHLQLLCAPFYCPKKWVGCREDLQPFFPSLFRN